MLNIKHATKYLGISRPTFAKLQIPFIKKGREKLFTMEELDKYKKYIKKTERENSGFRNCIRCRSRFWSDDITYNQHCPTCRVEMNELDQGSLSEYNLPYSR